mgnify:FL=1
MNDYPVPVPDAYPYAHTGIDVVAPSVCVIDGLLVFRSKTGAPVYWISTEVI